MNRPPLRIENHQLVDVAGGVEAERVPRLVVWRDDFYDERGGAVPAVDAQLAPPGEQLIDLNRLGVQYERRDGIEANTGVITLREVF